MRNALFTAASLAASAAVARASPLDDTRVDSIPGAAFTPGFNTYAGYVTVGDEQSRHMFYTVAEAQTEDPSSAPWLLWLNGGPGCSSLTGMFTENGPFVVGEDGSVTENADSWNTVANMIWLESPAGVGFSYGDSAADLKTGDAQTAADNYEAVLQILKLHLGDDLSQTSAEFFISGESYGGHYLPTLANEIFSQNAQAAPEDVIPLAGMAVGNGLTDEQYDFNSPMLMYRGHSLISDDAWETAVEACGGETEFYKCSGYVASGCTAACASAVGAASKQVGPIDAYDVDGDVCLSGKRVETAAFRMARMAAPADAVIWPTCIEEYATDYLNQDDVKAAFHANADITWSQCSSTLNYDFSHDSMIPLYEQFAAEQPDFDVVVYSGTSDSVLPTLGTQAWIASMNLTVVDDWHYWTADDGQNAGYTTTYDAFRFLTVKLAGHMVPETQPGHALSFVSRWLAGEEF